MHCALNIEFAQPVPFLDINGHYKPQEITVYFYFAFIKNA